MIITWTEKKSVLIAIDKNAPNDGFVQNPIVVLQPIETVGTDKHYEHTQAVPSATWTINHNLGKYPAITTVDTSDREWYGDVIHNSINQAVVSFAASFGGKAYCN